ncbi:hypothetical protein L6452_16529 [Arctium lappa]|uniref:Uncharacterized protein n=1 Tax=Arctium lappa TaxID=4217 RepID=A0ACB9C0S7_ARCLA|nr:hypothetical protein L6452_16529 [Arctium lappa]
MEIVHEAILELQEGPKHGTLRQQEQINLDNCMRISYLCQQIFTNPCAYKMTHQTTIEPSKRNCILSPSSMRSDVGSKVLQPPLKSGAAREAAVAIRKLLEILQFKTQIRYGKVACDAHTQSILLELRAQNMESRELRIRIEHLSKRAGHLGI